MTLKAQGSLEKETIFVFVAGLAGRLLQLEVDHANQLETPVLVDVATNQCQTAQRLLLPVLSSKPLVSATDASTAVCVVLPPLQHGPSLPSSLAPLCLEDVDGWPRRCEPAQLVLSAASVQRLHKFLFIAQNFTAFETQQNMN